MTGVVAEIHFHIQSSTTGYLRQFLQHHTGNNFGGPTVVGKRSSFGEMPMHKLCVSAASRQFLLAAAAQPAPNSAPALSLDQQNKISEIVTKRTAQPLTHIKYALERDALIPSNVAIERLPAQASSSHWIML
jgi:hypothetical protein